MYCRSEYGPGYSVRTARLLGGLAIFDQVNRRSCMHMHVAWSGRSAEFDYRFSVPFSDVSRHRIAFQQMSTSHFGCIVKSSPPLTTMHTSRDSYYSGTCLLRLVSTLHAKTCPLCATATNMSTIRNASSGTTLRQCNALSHSSAASRVNYCTDLHCRTVVPGHAH